MFARLAVTIFVVGVAVAQDPPRRPLSVNETVALQQSISVGKRIVAALSQYPAASASVTRTYGPDLLTQMPTVELLHAAGYISDEDFAFSRTCKAILQPLPAGAPTDYPVLAMDTSAGELLFDAQGEVTIRNHP